MIIRRRKPRPRCIGLLPVEVRLYAGELLGQCCCCGRILKVGNGPHPLLRTLRAHQPPGPTTAGHDNTLGTLWDHAQRRSIRA